MADTTTEDTPGPDLPFLARNIINQIGDLWHERIPSPLWVPVRQATNDQLDRWVTSLLRSALGDTVPRMQYDAKETQWREASRLLRERTGEKTAAERERDEARAERDAYRSDAEAWRRHMALQASVDNASPPRFATGGSVPHHHPFDAARAWAEMHTAPDTKTTALAEDREADTTDDCD